MMNRQKSFDEPAPSIYLVPTPIGNLQEISDRTREVLENADLIACEDTRNTGKLLHLLNIKTPLISHHEHNTASSVPKILAAIEEGKTVAVCSDAGYPLISDPGAGLVEQAVEKEIPVICISGPNAGLNALAASGLPVDHYLFYGFLDSRSTQRQKQLESLKEFPWTMIFYEAPHRISSCLQDMLTVLGNRKIVLARELTKLHEEYLRGTVEEILEVSEELRGEMVLVVSGNSEEKEPVSLEDAYELVQQKKTAGLKTKQAVREVSTQLNLSKNELYKYVIDREASGE